MADYSSTVTGVVDYEVDGKAYTAKPRAFVWGGSSTLKEDVGKKMEVRYDPAQPKHGWIKGALAPSTYFFTMLISFELLALMTAILGFFFGERPRRKS